MSQLVCLISFDKLIRDAFTDAPLNKVMTSWEQANIEFSLFTSGPITAAEVNTAILKLPQSLRDIVQITVVD